jgi:hypothetical protein
LRPTCNPVDVLKSTFIKITFVFLFCHTALVSVGQRVYHPQLWNNLNVAWNINEKFALRNSAAYNVLLSDELQWSEITYSVSSVFKFHRFMEGSAGLYLALTKQTRNLNSFEYRPYVGYRFFTNNSKRWYISNLTRLELRFFHYSNKTDEHAPRIRNRTDAVVSLNKKTMVENNNLFLFSYFEVFYSFEEEVQERFFDLFKYKIGLGYRHSYSWRFDLGFVFQDSRNTIEQPVNLPTNIITSYVIEWGVIYVIPPRKVD